MPRADQPPKTEYKAQQGTPDQLPPGEAQQLNEAVAAIPEEGKAAPEAEVAEPELAQAADYEPRYEPSNEDEDFLIAPTLKPEEDESTGIPTGASGVPPAVVRYLPTLQRIAARPDADPKIKLLVAMVLRELDRG